MYSVGIFRQGFLPKDTAIHHRSVVLDLVREALDEAGIKDPRKEIVAVAFTKVRFKLQLPYPLNQFSPVRSKVVFFPVFRVLEWAPHW